MVFIHFAGSGPILGSTRYHLVSVGIDIWRPSSSASRTEDVERILQCRCTVLIAVFSLGSGSVLRLSPCLCQCPVAVPVPVAVSCSCPRVSGTHLHWAALPSTVTRLERVRSGSLICAYSVRLCLPPLCVCLFVSPLPPWLLFWLILAKEILCLFLLKLGLRVGSSAHPAFIYVCPGDPSICLITEPSPWN